MNLKKVITDAAWGFYYLWIVIMVLHLGSMAYSTISFFNQTSEIAMTTQDQLAEYFLVHFPQNATLLVLDVLIMALMRSCMNKETPFMDQMFRRLKYIGFYLIGASLVQKLCAMIYKWCFSENGTQILTNGMSDAVIAGLGVVMLFLAVVIKYGIQLQQESDETL